MRLAWFEWFLTALGVGLLGLFVTRGQATDAMVGLLLVAYGSSRLEPQLALRPSLARIRRFLAARARPAQLARRLYARLSSQG